MIIYLEVPKKESEGETTAPSSVPGKIRRKVLKKKHYTNERGFLGKKTFKEREKP